MVEQDRVRTIIRMNKARKYDAAKEFLQKMLKRFPGTGKTGLWTLHPGCPWGCRTQFHDQFHDGSADAFRVSGCTWGCPKQFHDGSADLSCVVPTGAGFGTEVCLAFWIRF